MLDRELPLVSLVPLIYLQRAKPWHMEAAFRLFHQYLSIAVTQDRHAHAVLPSMCTLQHCGSDSIITMLLVARKGNITQKTCQPSPLEVLDVWQYSSSFWQWLHQRKRIYGVAQMISWLIRWLMPPDDCYRRTRLQSIHVPSHARLSSQIVWLQDNDFPQLNVS